MLRNTSSLSLGRLPAVASGECSLVAPAVSPAPFQPSLIHSRLCGSVCTLLVRHTCMYVKAAACQCLLLLLLRFPLHCDVCSVAPLAVGPAVSLLRSGNACVVKVALQMLDHLMGKSRYNEKHQLTPTLTPVFAALNPARSGRMQCEDKMSMSCCEGCRRCMWAPALLTRRRSSSV